MIANPIYPCLWFDGKAKEAAEYYCSIFKNSKITSENPFVIMFEVGNQKFMCLNGGSEFKFNESISFVINCDTQQEIDYYWNNFTANGGQESMCGWCKDKYGVSWQVVPSILTKLMANPQKTKKVIDAFLKMGKFNIDVLMKV